MANRPVGITLAAREADYQRQLWRLGLAAALMLSVTTALRPGAKVLAAGYGPRQSTGYGPNRLMGAYDVQPLHRQGLNGQGQTIAFVEVDGIDPGDLTS